MIIIGAGPAGLTASIYASCFHLKHLVIGASLGGQLQFAPDILNFPSFNNISGKELTNRIVEQAKKRGGEIVIQSVTNVQNSKFKIQNEQGKEIEISGFELETNEGGNYQSRAIILATGTERRKLNVPGEIEYTGKGMHYCATCEKLDYDNKICAVVGGANSAVQAAVEVAQAAKKVYILYRGKQLRGDQVWIGQITNNPKIEVIYDTVVKEILGDGNGVSAVRLAILNEEKIINIDKIFIEIGGVPGTALVIPLGVEMDKGGYINVNARLETNIPGIFAAGDLVSYALSIEQISSAIGLGARAAASAFAYIKKSKAPTLWGGSQIRR